MYLWGESAYVKAIISQYVYNLSIFSYSWQKGKKWQFIKKVFLVALISFHNAAEHCYWL